MENEEIDALLRGLNHFLQKCGEEELPYGESLVLRKCLQVHNCPYKQMAPGEPRRADALKNYGWKLTKRLKRVFPQNNIKKSTLHMLPDWLEAQQEQTPSQLQLQPPGQPQPLTASIQPSAPKLGFRFSCTRNDVDKIRLEIQDCPSERTRGKKIVCITGLSRSSQLELQRALIEQLEKDFDVVVVCDAEKCQTIHLLHQLVSTKIGYQAEGEPGAQALSELLRTHRILFVIDNTDTLFQPGALAGSFKEDAKEYEVWLQRLLEAPPAESCVLWFGQEKPFRFDLRAMALSCHVVSGLEYEDAKTLLRNESISVEKVKNWENLIYLCSGEPEWMLAEAAWIERRGTESLSTFSYRLVDRNIATAMEGLLDRLTNSEYLLLIWLMLKPCRFNQLCSLNIPRLSLTDREEALTSLERRHLVKQDEQHCYHLEPPLLRYVLAERSVRCITRELSQNNVATLGKHPLFDGTMQADQHTWQLNNLLSPLVEQQLTCNQDNQGIDDAIQSWVSQIRQLPKAERGYAVGNLINIASRLGASLSDLDIRDLPIYCADLRQANIHHANFEGCHFDKAILPLPFTGRLTAAIAKENTAIAIGDSAGHLFYWQQENGLFRLSDFRKASSSIDKLMFKDKHTILFASSQEVYQWQLGCNDKLKKLFDLPARASCMSASTRGYIAVGLRNGQIVLWETIRHHTLILDAHDNEVCSLAFCADGHRLASLGLGNRALIWQIGAGIDFQSSCQSLPTGARICTVAGWHRNTLLRAEARRSRLYVWLNETIEREISLPELEGNVLRLCFSPNGGCLAGSTDRGLVFAWNWQRNEAPYSIQLAASYPDVTAISDDGCWVLGILTSRVELYNLYNQAIQWKARAAFPNLRGSNIHDAQGWTSAEKDLLHSLCLEASE